MGMKASDVANLLKPFIMLWINDAFGSIGRGADGTRRIGSASPVNIFAPAYGGNAGSGTEFDDLVYGAGPWVGGSSTDFYQVGLTCNTSPYNFYGYSVFRMPPGRTTFTANMVYRMQPVAASGPYGNVAVKHMYMDISSSGLIDTGSAVASALIAANNPSTMHVVASGALSLTTDPSNYIMLAAEYIATCGFDGYMWFVGWLVDFT